MHKTRPGVVSSCVDQHARTEAYVLYLRTRVVQETLFPVLYSVRREDERRVVALSHEPNYSTTLQLLRTMRSSVMLTRLLNGVKVSRQDLTYSTEVGRRFFLPAAGNATARNGSGATVDDQATKLGRSLAGDPRHRRQ